MKQISKSDQRALILLAVFLIGAAGYFFVFQPLNAEYQKLRGMAQEKKKDVMNRQRMIRERQSWQNDADRLLKQSAELIEEIQLRSYSMTTEDILESLTGKAMKSGCTVESIRPVKVVSADGEDLPENYMITGKCLLADILEYVEAVDGMSLVEFNISGAKDGEPKDYYLRFAEVAKGDIDIVTQIVKDAGIKVAPHIIKPVQEVKKQPAQKAEKTQDKTPVTAAKQTPAASITLEGITSLGDTVYALLAGGEEPQYAAAGDSYGGYTVQSVTEEKAVVTDASGREMTLKFAGDVDGELSVSAAGESEMKADVSAPAEPEKQPEPKPGRLGVKAESAEYKGADVLRVINAGAQADVLHAGDMIISVNGAALNGQDTIRKAMKDVKAGDNVPLVVVRDGAETGVYIKATE